MHLLTALAGIKMKLLALIIACGTRLLTQLIQTPNQLMTNQLLTNQQDTARWSQLKVLPELLMQQSPLELPQLILALP
jgi:hypothetical protein